MKKVLSLVLAAVLAASLSACGGALVDLDTPKSEELTAQYDFYPDAMNTIRADMKITPEQADEVFIVLTSCGLDSKITSISESKGAYTVYYGGSSLTLYFLTVRLKPSILGVICCTLNITNTTS